MGIGPNPQSPNPHYYINFFILNIIFFFEYHLFYLFITNIILLKQFKIIILFIIEYMI